MSVTWKCSLVGVFLFAVAGGPAHGLVHQHGDRQLAQRQFIAPEMEIAGQVSRVADLPEAWRTPSLLALQNLGVEAQSGLFDPRGARWGTLLLTLPLIPGDGVGNALSWSGLGVAPPSQDQAIADLAWARLSDFLSAREDDLRLEIDELAIRSAAFDDGELVQFSGARVFRGIPVRTAAFTAIVSHGNLSLMGVHAWGDITLDLTPKLSADDAIVEVAKFVAPLQVNGVRSAPSLAIVPINVAAADHALGEGYAHRLAWVVNADVEEAFGQWEALVDAASGRLLSFQDLNRYGTVRNVNGGHYPTTYDGIPPDGVMQANYPMPFADVTVGGPFTDAGGNFTGEGNATTTLSGEFVRIDDQCAGAFSESSNGDIELGGTDGDVDCDTPTAGDNTAAARSGFYELNRIKELARGQLPGNAWLQGQLEANMNIDDTCDAFWNGATVNFFLAGDGCGNTGQISGVFDHEWGHGMDDFDVQGGVIANVNGGGEGVADLYASLRLDTSCVGRGFCQGNTDLCDPGSGGLLCGGYGDPCTAASQCSGIRDVDWANRASGQPHDLTWMQGNPQCGGEHCRGAVYAEAIWDLFKRDLPTLYGLDNNTAMEVTSRLLYLGGGNLSGWYSTAGAPHATCGAAFGYLQFLAADDDNGNIADGTPHMSAIASAFDRHEIDCSPANGGPSVQDGGCAANPTTQPNVTASAGSTTAALSWGVVPNAVSYNVYRTDGVFACDFGKALVGSTAGTSFNDTGLKNGHLYSYTVIPLGSGGAGCFGPASDCDTIAGDNLVFADGFESGDTGAWSQAVP